MAREVPEWIGKTENNRVPPRVKLRIFDRDGGICHICQTKIQAGDQWHADHVIALIEGGENRETNLRPAHAKCNLEKANGEKTRKAKVARTRKKYTGVIRPKQSIQSQGFTKAERKHEGRKALPPKPMFREAGE